MQVFRWKLLHMIAGAKRIINHAQDDVSRAAAVAAPSAFPKQPEIAAAFVRHGRLDVPSSPRPISTYLRYLFFFTQSIPASANFEFSS